nr:histone deacetylase 14 [Tanacetum cinerariifolium]
MTDVNAPSGQTPTMAPPVRADDQILPHIRWVPIGKSNCYLDLEKSQSNPFYKIAMDLLKNTNFFRAFTASSTIPSIYIQQFWDTILYNKKTGCYKCQLDEQWFDLTKETLREALQIKPVNHNQSFAAPPSIDGLIDFVNQLGYPKKHMSHPRPDSPLHLSNEEPVLGYLKFSAKGTKSEVFEMPIPDSLITVEIQQAKYYREYLAKPTQPARKPKAPTRPSISIPVRSAQPAPTSAPAKPQEKKHKQTIETSDKPPKEKKSKHGWVADEDADYQKVLEESMKDAYALPKGSLPPVVIMEPELGKYQPLPEVPGNGKAKVTEEQSPKTPPGSPSHQPHPPPLPAGPSGALGAPRASGLAQMPPSPPPPSSTNQESPSKGSATPSPSKIAASAKYQAWTMTDIRLGPFISLTPADLEMDEDMAPDEQAQSSDDEDIGNLEMDEDMAPDEQAQSSDDEDIGRITELKPHDLEGPAYEIAKVFHPDVIHLQYQMEECHKLLTDSVDDPILRHNVSKPLPLGGPPGQVTVQSDFFFIKDLEYLRYGSKGHRPALSISKIKTTYYPDSGLEQMVPDQFGIEEDCRYDITAMYGISHWWFQRQRFYIDRHTSEGDCSAVRTHMRILSVVQIEVFSMYGYDYMKKIVLRRVDLNEHVIAEREFKQLVIRQRVEDFQLGIESYQNQVNLTKPQWMATGFEYKHDYTVIESPRAVIFWDKYGVQMMMHFNEIHKFSDETLLQIDEALDYRVKEFRINRLNPEAFEDTEDLSQPGELCWRMRQRGRLQTFEAYRMIKLFQHSRPLSDDLITNLDGFEIFDQGIEWGANGVMANYGNTKDRPFNYFIGVIRMKSLGKIKKEKSENKGRVPTEMELELEHTQQGSSYEVSVSAEGVSLGKIKNEKSKNKGRVPTEMELELEHTQQGSSYEVSVAVCSSLRSPRSKRIIKSRAKRSSKIISLGHDSTLLASSHTVKSKTDIKSPTHYPCGIARTSE